MNNSSKNAYRTMFKQYPDVVDVKQVCKMLNLSRTKVYGLIKNGEIKRIPCGRIIKVAKVTVIDFVLQSAQ